MPKGTHKDIITIVTKKANN